MFKRWREQRAIRRVSRQLAAARRAGRGIYVGEWTFENLFNDELEAACEAGYEAIVAWCRETLGRCRRP